MAGEPAGHSRNITHNDSRKERHLVGKARIDRWFSGAGHRGNLVDAGAREPAFDESAAGRVEDALVDLAGEFPPGSPAAHRLPFLQRLLAAAACLAALIGVEIGFTSTASCIAP